MVRHHCNIIAGVAYQDNLTKEILMLIPFEFEPVYVINNTEVTRAKVPGGWMVTILVNTPRGTACFSTTFLSDPDHAWRVK